MYNSDYGEKLGIGERYKLGRERRREGNIGMCVERERVIEREREKGR